MTKIIQMNPVRVAVYGTLLKGCKNHDAHLKNAKLIGEFQTLPEYDMYSVRDAFPAVVENGNTSINMEVYEVDKTDMKDLDGLEGYNPITPDSMTNFYKRDLIETPYGVAYVYFYNRGVKDLTIIPTGDWKDYVRHIKINKNGVKYR